MRAPAGASRPPTYPVYFKGAKLRQGRCSGGRARPYLHRGILSLHRGLGYVLEHLHDSSSLIRSQRFNVKRLTFECSRNRAFRRDDTILVVGPFAYQIQRTALDLVENPAQVLADDSDHQELDAPEK